jgi:hypothetical protein
MDYLEAVALLGLDGGASVAEVRSAHSRLAKERHPDAGGSTAEMAALNEARVVALAFASNGTETMVPISVVKDLVRSQINLAQDRSERKEATDRAQRAIVRYEVDRLERRRRSAALAATVSGGLASSSAFYALQCYRALPTISPNGSH